MIREMIEALRKKGFSEEAIAFGVQVNKSTINRIVRGNITSPRHNLSNRIEQLFLYYCK